MATLAAIFFLSFANHKRVFSFKPIKFIQPLTFSLRFANVSIAVAAVVAFVFRPKCRSFLRAVLEVFARLSSVAGSQFVHIPLRDVSLRSVGACSTEQPTLLSVAKK